MKYSLAFGKKSSRIVLGTTYFGDGIDRDLAFQLMDRYYELGGCHLDTARSYANGISEGIVADWVKSRKANDVLICTKGGFPDPAAPEVMRLKKEEIRFDVETSLRALGLECIDFYWLHRDDRNQPVGEMVEEMNELIRQGKIRAYGASNWTVDRIEEANQYALAHRLLPFSASQIRFSPALILEEPFGLVGMDPASFSYYREKNLPVVAFSSQAKGFFSKLEQAGESGLSPKAKERYWSKENQEKFAVIQAIATKYQCSVGAVIGAAFSSLFAPEVFPIIGSSNVEQLEDSMSGADLTLSVEEQQAVFRSVAFE